MLYLQILLLMSELQGTCFVFVAGQRSMAAVTLVNAAPSGGRPVLSVSDELVLNAGDVLSMKCSGNKPLHWAYQGLSQVCVAYCTCQPSVIRTETPSF